LKISRFFLVVVVISLSLALFRFPTGAAFSPQPGDYFSYYEIQNVGNGTNYGGYSDHTTTTGTETMNDVAQNGTVSAHYSYSWSFSNNTGPTQTGSSSGNFTYSSNIFLYLKGNDSQTGYVGPITVWFAIDNTKPVGGTFYLLDTLMTVQSTDYSYHLTSENRDVDAIFASGSSNYERRDSYGNFSATYTWNAYFDPSSGYIIGYSYQEQDTNSSLAEGFSYTDQLYVTSTSYPLTVASTNAGSTGLTQYLGDIVIIVIVLVIIIIIAVALSRRRKKLPKHSQQFPPPGQYYRPPPGPPPQVDLTPKEPPVEQIVIKEVVKVKCRYCGALIDGTVQTCPFCGAPRT
jgi:hypothetical protein